MFPTKDFCEFECPYDDACPLDDLCPFYHGPPKESMNNSFLILHKTIKNIINNYFMSMELRRLLLLKRPTL